MDAHDTCDARRTDALGLIADARFGAMLARCAERAVSHAEFDRMEMPTGHTTDEVWGALTAIRRSQAIHYRDISHEQGCAIDQWFTPTRSIERILRELARRCATGSALDAALSERHGRRFITGSLVDETVAAVSCEGLSIGYEVARGIVIGEHVPTTPVETLVANMHALLVTMLDGKIPAINPAFIQAVYERLVDGIAEPEHLGTHVVWGDEWPEDPIGRDEALAQVCALASGALVDPAEHPIVTSQRIICKFWKTSPYPSCNYVMGSLLSRFHMARCGYPVFAYVPSSSMTLAWKHGSYTGEGVCPYHLAGNIEGPSRDWTPYWESCLRLLLNEVDALERHVFQLKAHDDELLAQLRVDRSLNRRQQGLLEQAILVPETVFRIEAHRRAHDLAYSTARQDLLSLVERGLLEMHYEGKAQAFTARRDMKRVLSEHYRAQRV